MPLPPKPLAFVGLVGIFPSGLAATPRQWFKRKNISAIRLTTPGVSTEGSIGLRQRSRVSTPIALVALPGDSGGALRARPEQPPVCARPNERLNLAALARLAFLNRDPHVATMSIDSKRLKKDSADAQAALAANGHARRRTGATALIEPALPLIQELRARKKSWAAIATALAKQDVVQGNDRKPITGRRLTALICAINKRVRRQAEKSAGRAKRRDLVPLPQQTHTLSLSADLSAPAVAATIVTASEEDFRREEFDDRVRSLLQKDSK